MWANDKSKQVPKSSPECILARLITLPASQTENTYRNVFATNTVFCPQCIFQFLFSSNIKKNYLGTGRETHLNLYARRLLLSDFNTVMRHITTFRSTTDLIYDGGPIRL
jgi:hypothetical protein